VVPLIGYFLGYRYGFIIWAGGLIAVVGFYLMTSGGHLGSLKGDLIAMVGLLVIAEKAAKFDQIVLSFFQFFSARHSASQLPCCTNREYYLLKRLVICGQ
jgi:drug/metabolite transporter (DMT)-like permease